MNVFYQWGLAEVDTDDYGMRVDYAFKGVSPDDIFEWFPGQYLLHDDWHHQ